MGFDSVRGQNLPSPIDLAGRRQHSAGATAQPVIICYHKKVILPTSTSPKCQYAAE